MLKIVAQAIFQNMSQRSVANLARSAKVSNELLTFAVRARKAWDVNAFLYICTHAKLNVRDLYMISNRTKPRTAKVSNFIFGAHSKSE